MMVKREGCRSAGIYNHYEVFLVDLPDGLITDIIIGPLMSLGDRAKILNARTEKYPRVELFEARLSPTKFDLDIEYFYGPRRG